jgi:hypothetical protein
MPYISHMSQQWWQQGIVFLIVALAALHVSVKYLPVSWRKRMVYFFSFGPTGAGTRQSNWWRSTLTNWLAPGAGCGGGCSRCKEPSQACSTVSSTASEVLLPAPDVLATVPMRVIKLHVAPDSATRR